VSKDHYVLALSFTTKEDMLEYARLSFGEDVVVYRADGLDREYGKHAPANSFVVRRRGERPKDYEA
jgi:hypothetical protein